VSEPKIAGVSWKDWVRGVEIEPSIYAASFLDLRGQLDDVLAAGARILQFDVGDGHFVEPVTIGPIVIESIAPFVHGRGGVLDCHLMVDNPERHFAQVARAGGDSVTFHVEATDDPARTAALARSHGLAVGIACNPETSVEAAASAAAAADAEVVLCMGIHPGYSGQALLPETLERAAQLRRLLPDRVFVQVDGGVKRDNVAAVRAAGVALIVAGSAVFHAERPGAAYAELAAAVA